MKDKRSNMVWLVEDEPRPEVLKTGFRSRKRMFTIFFSTQCMSSVYVAVQIIVRMSTGIDVRLNLLKSSTIKNVKEKIQSSDDIPCDRQYLYFHDELLIDNHTLSDYNIQNESILRCLVKIRIHIKMPNEDEISIDANPDDDVRSVRDRILARVPIPPDQLFLVYNGKKLNNRCTMKHYNLRNGSILYVVKSTGTSVSLLFFELCNFVFKTN